jgi:hypothetical protein
MDAFAGLMAQYLEVYLIFVVEGEYSESTLVEHDEFVLHFVDVVDLEVFVLELVSSFEIVLADFSFEFRIIIESDLPVLVHFWIQIVHLYPGPVLFVQLIHLLLGQLEPGIVVFLPVVLIVVVSEGLELAKSDKLEVCFASICVEIFFHDHEARFAWDERIVDADSWFSDKVNFSNRPTVQHPVPMPVGCLELSEADCHDPMFFGILDAASVFRFQKFYQNSSIESPARCFHRQKSAPLEVWIRSLRGVACFNFLF